MADTSLSKEQGLTLLNKLAHEDAFRAHFEKKPAEALLEMGIPAELICRLPGACLHSRKLASKAAMEETRQRLANDVDRACLAFVIPTPKF